MAKKRKVRNTVSRSTSKNSSPRKNSLLRMFGYILLVAVIVYGIYHIIVIDTIEGFQIILGIIVLYILVKLVRMIYRKLKKVK